MKLAHVALGAAALTVFSIAATSPQGAKKSASPPKRAVTYAEDVASILNEKCVSCHRPGEVAPFSLVGYENAKKWSGMTSSVTKHGIMPPWKAVEGYGEFKDPNTLTKEQIQAIADWHEAGAPRGDAKKEPETPKFNNSEWGLGTPDMVLGASKPYKLDAEGEDVYRNFVMKSDWKEPIWIKAMEVKPSNRRIVHHVIAFLDDKGGARRLEAANKDGQEGYTGPAGGTGFMPSGSLGGWAPGTNAQMSPKGIAFKVDPGEEIVLQVHYHKTGKVEEDLTKIGLYTAKEPIEKEMDLNWVFNFGINIPAGEKEYKSRREFTWKNDVTMYGAMPHMHLLGRKMKSWLEYADGTVKPLIQVDDWDFNWQLTYVFKEPIKIPAGTKQIVEAVYDNSSENLRNPNSPPKRVTFGEKTTDEMFLMIFPYTLGK
ncbi:MAG: ascorbate-dependent monooxygenase [Fimbriimonas sp.]